MPARPCTQRRRAEASCARTASLSLTAPSAPVSGIDMKGRGLSVALRRPCVYRSSSHSCAARECRSSRRCGIKADFVHDSSVASRHAEADHRAAARMDRFTAISSPADAPAIVFHHEASHSHNPAAA